CVYVCVSYFLTVCVCVCVCVCTAVMMSLCVLEDVGMRYFSDSPWNGPAVPAQPWLRRCQDHIHLKCSSAFTLMLLQCPPPPPPPPPPHPRVRVRVRVRVRES